MYQKKELKKMRRNVDLRTIWSLTAIRNGKQENADGIGEAQFCYGRWPSEVSGSTPKRIPSGLIGMIDEFDMEQEAMESGFMVYMTASPDDRESWVQFVSTVTVRDFDSRLLYDSRTLFSRGEREGETIEFVDLYNPCAGGIEMPNNVWLKIGELPMSTLGWAMGSGIMEADKSRQTNLNQWIGKPIDQTIVPSDIMSLPGPPSRAYSFHDSD